MMNETVTAALNEQINAELYSAYLYFSMSSHASFIGLKGAANWFLVQAQEELSHVQKFHSFLNSRSERVVLTAIAQPPIEFESLTDMFELTLQHEQKVTALIDDLVSLAQDVKDHASEIFLQWFVTEQIEEEENVNEVLSKLKLTGNAPGGLFMVDKELGARVFTPPVI